jgi:two-component system chemotaxis response regulator CheB
MPLNAVDPDYCLPLAEIAPLLVKLADQPVANAVLAKLRGSTGGTNNHVPVADDLHPAFVCPECDGPLTQNHNGNLITYQCKIGRRFSPESLSEAASETLERGLWIAVRSLEDRASIHCQRASRYTDFNRLDQAPAALEIAVRAEQGSKTLRQIMERL